jgi:hypothetical protein
LNIYNEFYESGYKNEFEYLQWFYESGYN